MKSLYFLLIVLSTLGGCFCKFQKPESFDLFPVIPSTRIKRVAEPERPRLKNPLWNATWIDKLKHDLLINYDKFARPVNYDNNTYVRVTPILKHIELDERKAVMTIHCWLKTFWRDEKLKWDPEKYGGIKLLHLVDHEVWQPDIHPYNSASGPETQYSGSTNVMVHDNGTVFWVPPTIYHVLCPLDFTKWPFDTQECYLQLGSWTYDGSHINLSTDWIKETTEEAISSVQNLEWNIVGLKVTRNTIYYNCCEAPFYDIRLYITIRRNSATYRALIITPIFVIVVMTLATFWLPSTSGDKITLGGSAVVITSLFILYFTQLPILAGPTPYIVQFYSSCLYLTSFSLLIAVTVINLTKNPKSSSLAWPIKKHLTGWLGKCLLIKQQDDRNFSKVEEMSDCQPVLSDQARQLSGNSWKSYQNDWVLLATAIDRIFFLLYSLSFIFLAIAYSV